MGPAIIQAAAILGGLIVLASAAWRWLIGPAFTRAVGEVVEARITGAIEPIMAELSMNGGKSVKDVVNRIEGQVSILIGQQGTKP